MPGVVGAWKFGELGLADDFMPEPGPTPPPFRRPLLVGDEVRFEGDAVAVVAAESEYQAHDAALAIEVDMTAAAPDRAESGTHKHAFGDSVAAFEGAAVRVREGLGMARIAGAAIEPRAALAEWSEAASTMTIRASAGWVYGLRDAVAACLGLEKDRVVAVSDDIGGSFGAKNPAYPEYILAAAVSRRLGRPVRWVAARSDDTHTTGQAHAARL